MRQAFQGELQGAMVPELYRVDHRPRDAHAAVQQVYLGRSTGVFSGGIPFLAAALLTLICLTVFSFVVIRHGISGQLRN